MGARPAHGAASIEAVPIAKLIVWHTADAPVDQLNDEFTRAIMAAAKETMKHNRGGERRPGEKDKPWWTPAVADAVLASQKAFARTGLPHPPPQQRRAVAAGGVKCGGGA